MSTVTTAVIGANIRAHRKARGMTTTQLAAVAGYSDGHIREVEGGRREPSAECVATLAQAIGVSAEVLEREASSDTVTPWDAGWEVGFDEGWTRGWADAVAHRQPPDGANANRSAGRPA